MMITSKVLRFNRALTPNASASSAFEGSTSTRASSVSTTGPRVEVFPVIASSSRPPSESAEKKTCEMLFALEEIPDLVGAWRPRLAHHADFLDRGGASSLPLVKEL